MALSTGTRLGPYEIVSPLGAGGMGEVYRAKDTRLDRTVAVKVLPPQSAENPEARQRFEREARAVSSLNHPHICILYDVGRQDSTDFLVMEYLEGESLAARLAGGALPADQALRYAVQIAEALADAHRHGVFHRDLKPGNVILTKAGAKLLDFGLAKMREGVSDAASVTVGPNKDLTQAGAILGTVQYMAPEQLEGKEADARSDIFAFGAVVYEMLTGRKAYPGNSTASVIGAIMTSPPPSVSAVQPVAPAVDRVVQKCLAKDPAERWQTAQDLASEMKWLSEGGSQLTASVALPAAAAPAAPAPRPPSSRVWRAATAVLLLAAAVVAFRHFREAPPRQQTIRFQVPVPEKETVQELALAPDGERLAFTTGLGGDTRLWVRPLDSFTSQPLPGTEGAYLPFWSPDSRAIAFFAGDKLKKIDLLGGPPQTLCDAGNGRPGAWNREGVILFRPVAGPLHRVSASGGETRPATALDASRQEITHGWAQFLPDGRHFIYTAVSSVAENSAVYAASLDSKETKRLLSGNLNAAYTRDVSGQGYLLFARAGTLLAQRFDAGRLEFEGEPFPIAENVSFVFGPGGQPIAARFSAAETGVLTYQHGGGTAIKELVWLDRNGKRLGAVGEPADYSNPALSPDEKRLAISRMDAQLKTRDIWIFDLARGTSSRFTFDRADDFNPTWSPDGKRLAFTSTRKGPRNLYIKDSSGTGEEQVLLESDENKPPEDWSPDGRFLIFNSNSTKKPVNDVMALPLEGDRKPVPLLTGPYTEDTAQVSPDGRWLVYRSNETGRFEVYVQSFPGLLAGRSEGKWQVSTAGGTYPEWRRDGQEIFYLTPDNKLMAVGVKTGGAAFEAAIPKPLFEVRLEAATRRTHFLPAANGQRFLVVQLQEQAASSPINVVVNWARPGTQQAR